MGGTVATEPPLWFMKPTDAVIDCSSAGGSTSIPLPGFSRNVQWEAELVVILDKGGKNIDVSDAMSHIFGFAAGCDLTARDRQMEFKKTGRPWEVSKSFDFSGLVGAVLPKAQFGSISDQRLLLLVNGEVKQDITLDKLIMDIPNQIAVLSKLFHLYPGDVIFTGTPAGVNQMHPGDRLEISCTKGNVKLECNLRSICP